MKSILVEMAFLGFAVALVAVPFAFALSSIMTDAISQVVFYFPLSFSVEPIGIMIMVGFLLVVISAIVPMRYVLKLKPEMVLRERDAG